MGGKGKKRREKNYKEAHGVGKNRLPPPPVRSSLDVMPSKLRKLISYISGSEKLSMDGEENRRGGGKLIENKLSSKEKSESVASESKLEDHHDQDAFSTEKKKKKRKRKQVDDLRFADELGAVGLKRKERKKRLLQERKMKHKKVKQDEDNLDFPGHEEIKFGEVVQAPPKLVNIPKQFGSSMNASQERIRLKVIEAYREQKKWASRPGLHLPAPDITPPEL
uniref:chromatin assembly factor 1 subunit A n=1 Tax=Erigeron canadensis TaxID=72917 RepID=UPI001CB96237|nr:chromatin assembly factor 1 subunit A [Erigeron canadensis]